MKNVTKATLPILISLLTPAIAGAWENGPTLHMTDLYTADTYLAGDAANISNESGYIGDLAVLLQVGGTGNYSFYGNSAAGTNFGNDMWIKLDASTASQKGSGTIALYGVQNADVTGDINISLENYSYSSTTNIYAANSGSGNSVSGSINVDMSDSSINVFNAVNSSGASGVIVNGDLNINATRTTIATLSISDGQGSNIKGNVNIYLKDSTVGTPIFMQARGTSDGSIVDGNMNVTIDGGTLSSTLRVAPNGGSSEQIVGRIKGDINVVLGGRYDDVDTYLANSTYIAATDGESVLMTGGRHGSADGNSNLTVVSGTYAGSIAMGPNSATLGTSGNPNSGNTNLTILDGTFNGVIYAGSHNKGSSVSSGIILGNSNLTVSGGTFNANIYVGAYSVGGGGFVNEIKGNATATFSSLGNVTFGSNVTIYGGTADGKRTLNFTNATGNFGASIAQFDVVKLGADSHVALTNSATIDSVSLAFDVSTLGNGHLTIASVGDLSIGQIDIFLFNDLLGTEGSIELIKITDNGSLAGTVINILDENGNPLADSGWESFFESGSFGIKTATIPEPSTYSFMFGLVTLALPLLRRRR